MYWGGGVYAKVGGIPHIYIRNIYKDMYCILYWHGWGYTTYICEEYIHIHIHVYRTGAGVGGGGCDEYLFECEKAYRMWIVDYTVYF